MPAAITTNNSSMELLPVVRPPYKERKVVRFEGWDSEEERQRSARGDVLRQRVKEERRQRRMANQYFRNSARNAYAALVNDANWARLDGFAREPHGNNFRLLFGQVYQGLVDAGLLVRSRGEQGTSAVLNRIRRAAIEYTRIVPHPNLVNDLALIGLDRPFHDTFLGATVSDDEETPVAAAPSAHPAQASQPQERQDQVQHQAKPQDQAAMVREHLRALNVPGSQMDRAFDACGYPPRPCPM